MILHTCARGSDRNTYIHKCIFTYEETLGGGGNEKKKNVFSQAKAVYVV